MSAMSDRSETVSFRLPPSFYSQLSQEAGKRSLSLHEVARQIVIDRLTDAAREEERQQLADLKQTLETLREDLATAAAAMLAFGGKWTAEQAQKWARETLLGPGK